MNSYVYICSINCVADKTRTCKDNAVQGIDRGIGFEPIKVTTYYPNLIC